MSAFSKDISWIDIANIASKCFITFGSSFRIKSKS